MFGAGADGAVFRDTYKTAHEILVKFPQRINAKHFGTYIFRFTIILSRFNTREKLYTRTV